MEFFKSKSYPDLFLVSKCGEVKSVRTGIIYKQFKTKKGYMTIATKVNGVNLTVKVHRLVAEFFCPNPNNKPQVNHINGVKYDNRVENLEWVTGKENTEHARKTGLASADSIAGALNVFSKLSESDVEWIRSNYVSYSRFFGCRPLAEKFNVHHTQISRVVRKASYNR